MSYNINSLLIKPAGPDCNIACEYCFYSDKKELFNEMPVHRMTVDTMEKVISQYLALAGPQASLGFQGGEPTLCGIEFFAQVMDAVKKYKRPGQQVNVALQTNGMLLDEAWAKLLKANNVLVGLSVDGPEDIHNAHRRTHNDKDTFDRVTQSMELLKKEGVDFNTLTVITKRNVTRGAELIQYFREHGSGYMQFIPCVEVLDGQIAHYTPTPDEYADFLIEVFDIWYNDGQPQCYVRLFDEMLISFVEYQPASCYFAPKCVANLVIEHDGSIYPCDFFVDNEWYLGNIHETSFQEITKNPLLPQFIERKQDLDEKCRSCKWKSICCGDCPKYRWSQDGEAINSAYFCEGYKRFFENAAPKLLALKKDFLTPGHHQKTAYWRQMEAALERNQSCPCGSGSKFKKCCAPIKHVNI